MSQVLVELPFIQKKKFLQIENLQQQQSLEELLEKILIGVFNLPQKLLEQVYLQQQNKIVSEIQNIRYDKDLTVQLRLPGGKGGFGSLMKAQAKKRTNITNWDNSRDENGRRIGHQTMENRLVDYYKKKKEQDKKLRKMMEDYKREQATQKQGEQVALKQEFKDKIDAVEQNMSIAIIQGLKAKNKFNINQDQGKDLKVIQEQEQEEEKEEEKEDYLKNNQQKKSQKNIVIREQNIGEDEEEGNNNLLGKRKNSQQQQQEEEPIQEKKVVTEDTKQQQQEWGKIELDKVQSMEELQKYEDGHLKAELQRLGLKCGGRNQDRVKRLWDIKTNPTLLFSPKYLAKK